MNEQEPDYVYQQNTNTLSLAPRQVAKPQAQQVCSMTLISNSGPSERVKHAPLNQSLKIPLLLASQSLAFHANNFQSQIPKAFLFPTITLLFPTPLPVFQPLPNISDGA